jgi:hypothetical protein
MSNKLFRIENGRWWWVSMDLIIGSASKFGFLISGTILESAIMGKTLPSRPASMHIVMVQQIMIDDDI